MYMHGHINHRFLHNTEELALVFGLCAFHICINMKHTYGICMGYICII